MVCGVLEALSLMVMLPVRVPDWVGVNFTLIVQLLPTGKVTAVQLSVSVNSPLADSVVRVSSVVPVLVKVTATAPLVMPTAWLPRLTLLELKPTAGAGEMRPHQVPQRPSPEHGEGKFGDEAYS